MISRLLFGAVALSFVAFPATAQDAAEGRRIAERWCVECHLIDDNASTVAPDAGPPFAALARDPGKSEGALRGFLSDPHPPMPPFNFERDDIEHLIAYIKSLGLAE